MAFLNKQEILKMLDAYRQPQRLKKKPQQLPSDDAKRTTQQQERNLQRALRRVITLLETTLNAPLTNGTASPLTEDLLKRALKHNDPQSLPTLLHYRQLLIKKYVTKLISIQINVSGTD
jgi:hypothetical protein